MAVPGYFWWFDVIVCLVYCGLLIVGVVSWVWLLRVYRDRFVGCLLCPLGVGSCLSLVMFGMLGIPSVLSLGSSGRFVLSVCVCSFRLSFKKVSRRVGTSVSVPLGGDLSGLVRAGLLSLFSGVGSVAPWSFGC